MSATPLGIEIAQQILIRARREDWQAGTPLVERALAADFGVSRSPVRAALRLLESKGVVGRSADSRALVLTRAAEEVSAVEVNADLPSTDLERTYLAIVRDRFSQALPEHVSESDLMRRYDVSRATLRNALLRLMQEGLAERRRGHGWQFMPMIDSVEADRESYEFRMAIEPAGLRSSSFKADPRWLEKARGEHERMIAGGIREVSGAEFFELNAEFHEMLARFSGNRYILEAVRKQNRLRRAAEYESFPFSERMLRSCREHLAILDALLGGDRELAANLMIHHLAVSRKGGLPFGGDGADRDDARPSDQANES